MAPLHTSPPTLHVNMNLNCRKTLLRGSSRAAVMLKTEDLLGESESSYAHPAGRFLGFRYCGTSSSAGCASADQQFALQPVSGG